MYFYIYKKLKKKKITIQQHKNILLNQISPYFNLLSKMEIFFF